MVRRSEAILIGWKEISAFCGMSEHVVRGLTRRFENVPINNDGRVFADRETLNEWLRLYARGQAIEKREQEAQATGNGAAAAEAKDA